MADRNAAAVVVVVDLCDDSDSDDSSSPSSSSSSSSAEPTRRRRPGRGRGNSTTGDDDEKVAAAASSSSSEDEKHGKNGGGGGGGGGGRRGGKLGGDERPPRRRGGGGDGGSRRRRGRGGGGDARGGSGDDDDADDDGDGDGGDDDDGGGSGSSDDDLYLSWRPFASAAGGTGKGKEAAASAPRSAGIGMPTIDGRRGRAAVAVADDAAAGEKDGVESSPPPAGTGVARKTAVKSSSPSPGETAAGGRVGGEGGAAAARARARAAPPRSDGVIDLLDDSSPDGGDDGESSSDSDSNNAAATAPGTGGMSSAAAAAARAPPPDPDGDDDAPLAAEAPASAAASASAASPGRPSHDENDRGDDGSAAVPSPPSRPAAAPPDLDSEPRGAPSGDDDVHEMEEGVDEAGGEAPRARPPPRKRTRIDATPPPPRRESDDDEDVVLLLSSDDDGGGGREGEEVGLATTADIREKEEDDSANGSSDGESDDDDLPRGGFRPTFHTKGGDSSANTGGRGGSAATAPPSKRGCRGEDEGAPPRRRRPVPTPVTRSQPPSLGAEDGESSSSSPVGRDGDSIGVCGGGSDDDDDDELLRGGFEPTFRTKKGDSSADNLKSEAAGDESPSSPVGKSGVANPYARPRQRGKAAATATSTTDQEGDEDDSCHGDGNGGDPDLIPTPPLPVLNEIGGKLYPDLRHHFVRSLHVYARKSRHAAYNRSAFDSTLRAIVVLSLRGYPVRSHDACRRVRGIGDELRDVLRESSESFLEGLAAASKGRRGKGRGGGGGGAGAGAGARPYRPPGGKFCAAAPAALVALLNYEADQRRRMRPKDDDAGAVDATTTILCPMEELLRGVNALLDDHPTDGGSHVLDQPTEYYLDRNVLDVEWGQIRKLCSENVHAELEACIKERRKKNLCPSGVVFELLPHGRTIARRLKRNLLREEEEDGDASGCRRGERAQNLGPLRQLASSSVHRDYASVTMCVDFREGGGGGKSLHRLCDLLDDHRVPFVVRELRISDYIFFVSDKIAPILIERKTVDDVANSLADGRWERQQRNMRMAQFVLGGGAKRRCQICYLVEGDASRRVVHGGNVGRRSWDQSLEDVENAIANLPKLGFSVMRSKSRMGTMVILSRVAKDVAWKAKNGSIDAPYTYDEFLRRMKQCPEREGDPPVLEEHQNPAPPVVDDYSNRGGGARAHGAAAASSSDPPDRRTVDGSHVRDEEADESAETGDDAAALSRLSVQQLKNMCKERFEQCSGKKAELIGRLLKPRKPESIITRLRRGQYVPKVPSSNAALMVALLLNQSPSNNDGVTKDSLMAMAEETGVGKDPMSGNGGFYDGWSGMKDLLSGDPALVYVKKKKYSLTTHPAGSAGVNIARALHVLAHREGWCKCGDQVIDVMT